MEELFDVEGPLAQWVQQWGYVAVFFGILLENAGIPVPGESIIVIASVLASQKLLRIELVYAVVTLGAILGDNLGYWLGQHGGRPLLRKLARWGHVSEAQLAAAEAQFLKHSDWAVFFGRFVALLRIFAGPIAGMVQMPWHRFFFFNALGAAIWCALVVGLAFVLGKQVTVLLHNLGLTLLGLVAIVASVVGYKLWQKRREERVSGKIDE